jgi:hypothetical protein
LQGGLVGLLATQVLEVVGRDDGRALCRVPQRGVDAVQDSGQRIRASMEYALQAFAELGREAPARLERAHRGDCIGRRQRVVHERQVAVKFEAWRCQL